MREYTHGYLKKYKGITLVALVVTIVVLIILATISINIIFGEEGILTRARYARDHMSNAEAEEQIAIEDTANYVDWVIGSRESVTLTTEELNKLIKEQIDEKLSTLHKVYPEGEVVTVNSNFSNEIQNYTAPEDGWVVLQGLPGDTGTIRYYWLKVGNLVESSGTDSGWTIAASLPCKKGTNIQYRIYGGDNTKKEFMFIPNNAE